MAKSTVTIQYCVPCGHLPRALDIQKAILERLGRRLDGVKLKTGEAGVFTIDLDDERVYTKPEEFDLDALLANLDQRVAAGTV